MRHIIVSLLLLLATNSCYDNHKYSTTKEFAELANCDIAQLQQLCKDKCYIINSDLVCVGRVTSSDHEGNFYRSMVIEDGTGGVEILLGTYDIAAQYPIGVMVAIELNGTAIMVKNGVVQIGLPPHSFDSSPREFESQVIIDKHIKRSNSVENIAPLCCNLTTLDTSLCGRFVQVKSLQYSPIEDNESDYHRFTDSNANEIFLHISPYANFANLDFPDTDTTIQGILYYENVGLSIGKQYVIQPRFADDITTSRHTF